MSDPDFGIADGTDSDDGSTPSVAAMNAFLSIFGAELIGADDDGSDPMVSAADARPSQQTMDSIARADAAFAAGRWDDVRREYTSDVATPEARAAIVTKMLTSDHYHDRLRHDPMLTSHLLASATVNDLNACDYLNRFSRSKIDVFANAMDFMVRPGFMLRGDKKGFPDVTRDPDAFALLASKLPQKYWNDTQMGLAASERGLGPRICAGLFNMGGFDEICALIDMGVDTTRSALAQGGDMGTYSGFVAPLQHLIQDFMSDIPKLGTDAEQGWDDQKKAKVRGAAQIFAALDAHGSAVTLTCWQDVVASDLLAEFAANPGTIWGFEGVRGPFVEAAHDTDQGTQPVRMMEIWEAVEPVLRADDYVELLDNPNRKIPQVIIAAIHQIERDFPTNDKYAHARGDDGTKKKAYIKAFVVAAQSYLETFVKQIPEGVVSRNALVKNGKPRPSGNAVKLSELMGFSTNSAMATIACKAGLWAARDEGKPVYYVMDGINMQDVVDYKKVQNKAIKEFLANGGIHSDAATFQEVITMQEVREFLTHWDELGDTVKICIKGEILEGRRLADFITTHQQNMQDADDAAQRAPAADLIEFKPELMAIDSDIYGTLEKAVRKGANPDEVNMDARDIVLKANYVLRISAAKPSLVLRYILGKCDVLFQYGLLSAALIEPAKLLATLAVAGDGMPPDSVVQPIAGALKAAINNCTKKVRQPLTKALLEHPLLQGQ